jgi:ElaA protein
LISFKWFKFSELTTQQLYEVLALRSEVFVVEQKILCLDADGEDDKAYHLLGFDNKILVAYARLFPPTVTSSYLNFGRVLTAKSVRRLGYGKLLVQELLDYCSLHYPGINIHCSAQYYIQKFYQDLGFKAYGEIYDEEGIEHIGMKRESLT